LVWLYKTAQKRRKSHQSICIFLRVRILLPFPSLKFTCVSIFSPKNLISPIHSCIN
jgi:hypothetical protein